jgi:hypothetical protein
MSINILEGNYIKVEKEIYNENVKQEKDLKASYKGIEKDLTRNHFFPTNRNTHKQFINHWYETGTDVYQQCHMAGDMMRIDIQKKFIKLDKKIKDKFEVEDGECGAEVWKKNIECISFIYFDDKDILSTLVFNYSKCGKYWNVTFTKDPDKSADISKIKVVTIGSDLFLNNGRETTEHKKIFNESLNSLEVGRELSDIFKDNNEIDTDKLKSFSEKLKLDMDEYNISYIKRKGFLHKMIYSDDNSDDPSEEFIKIIHEALGISIVNMSADAISKAIMNYDIKEGDVNKIIKSTCNEVAGEEVTEFYERFHGTFKEHATDYESRKALETLVKKYNKRKKSEINDIETQLNSLNKAKGDEKHSFIKEIMIENLSQNLKKQKTGSVIDYIYFRKSISNKMKAIKLLDSRFKNAQSFIDFYEKYYKTIEGMLNSHVDKNKVNSDLIKNQISVLTKTYKDSLSEVFKQLSNNKLKEYDDKLDKQDASDTSKISVNLDKLTKITAKINSNFKGVALTDFYINNKPVLKDLMENESLKSSVESLPNLNEFLSKSLTEMVDVIKQRHKELADSYSLNFRKTQKSIFKFNRFTKILDKEVYNMSDENLKTTDESKKQNNRECMIRLSSISHKLVGKRTKAVEKANKSGCFNKLHDAFKESRTILNRLDKKNSPCDFEINNAAKKLNSIKVKFDKCNDELSTVYALCQPQAVLNDMLKSFDKEISHNKYIYDDKSTKINSLNDLKNRLSELKTIKGLKLSDIQKTITDWKTKKINGNDKTNIDIIKIKRDFLFFKARCNKTHSAKFIANLEAKCSGSMMKL